MTLSVKEQLSLDSFQDKLGDDENREPLMLFGSLIRLVSSKRFKSVSRHTDAGCGDDDGNDNHRTIYARADICKDDGNDSRDHHSSDDDGYDDYDDEEMPTPRRIPSMMVSPSLHERPSLIHVNVQKRVSGTVGLTLLDDDFGIVRIASKDPLGLLGKTPLEVGDIILSINHQSVTTTTTRKRNKCLDAEACQALLEEEEEESCQDQHRVQLVARNENGQPFWVSTTVSKPSPSAKVGLGFKRRGQSVRISSIACNGIMSASVLNVGDEIVAVENVRTHGMQSRQVAALFEQEPNMITVVTRPELETAAVLAMSTHIQVDDENDGDHDEIATMVSAHVIQSELEDMTLSRRRRKQRSGRVRESWGRTNSWLMLTATLLALAGTIALLMFV